MAEPVYDKEDDSGSLKPEALRNLENEPGAKPDKAEDQDTEEKADADEPSGKKTDDEKEAASSKELQDQWQKAKDSDKAAGKSLYNPGWQKEKNFIKTLQNRRRLLIGAGVATTLIIGVIVALFSFLNVFKLDDIMSNIDSKSFARLNGVSDRRSVSWMQAYMEARMLDIGDNPNLNEGDKSDNLLFRSEKVSTGSPFLDWYKTMRTSKFEQDLLENNGIKFTSVLVPNGSGGYQVRAGKIDINGEQPITINLSDADITNIQNGDVPTLNKFRDSLSTNVFGSDKDARAAIKDAVQDNTHFFQVYKRRQLRKNIQNMVGVRSWTFFEKTQNAYQEKKINIRNKIISAAIPEDTLSGKFVRCLFGISDCNFNGDPSAPENQDAGALDGNGNPDDDTPPVDDESGKPIKGTDVPLGPAADFVKDVISKVAPGLDAVNIVSTLDSLNRVNNAIESGKISQGVAVAKGIQAMGLYQVFETARDQIKTGQVSSSEVNDFMQVIGPVAASESWNKVIEGNGNPSQLTDTAASNSYCSSKSQAQLQANPNLATTDSAYKYAYLCPDKQIGGSSNASTLETDYKNTIGVVIGPVLAAYNKVRNAPVIGAVTGFFENIVGSFSGLLNSLVIEPILKITGLSGDLNSAVEWMVGEVASFLGAGPIMSGNEPGGVYMNWLVQGGAYTAEAAARAAGAAASTAQSIAVSQAALNGYNQTQQSQESLADRYFSTSNPNSPTAKTLLAVSQIQPSSIGSSLMNFGSIFKVIGSGLTAPFTRSAHAAADNGYSAANFAGIQTYDFPSQCYNLDPITAQPLDGTNALAIFKQNGIAVPAADMTKLQSWDTENNSTDFYATIYDAIDNSAQKANDGAIAEQIYNCNLLDNAVRGSLGNLYGYTDDNGLN